MRLTPFAAGLAALTTISACGSEPASGGVQGTASAPTSAASSSATASEPGDATASSDKSAPMPDTSSAATAANSVPSSAPLPATDAGPADDASAVPSSDSAVSLLDAEPRAPDSGGTAEGIHFLNPSCRITREVNSPAPTSADSQVIKIGDRFAVLQQSGLGILSFEDVELNADYCTTCTGLSSVIVNPLDDGVRMLYVDKDAESLAAYSWQPGETERPAASNPVFSDLANTPLVTVYAAATSRDGRRVVAAAGDRVITQTLSIAVLNSDAALVAPVVTLDLESNLWEQPTIIPTTDGAIVSVNSEAASAADIVWYLRRFDAEGAVTFSKDVVLPEAANRGFRSPPVVVADDTAVYALWQDGDGERFATRAPFSENEEPTLIDPWPSVWAMAGINQLGFVAETVTSLDEAYLVQIDSISLDGTQSQPLFSLNDELGWQDAHVIATEGQTFWVTHVLSTTRWIREIACDDAP